MTVSGSESFRWRQTALDAQTRLRQLETTVDVMVAVISNKHLQGALSRVAIAVGLTLEKARKAGAVPADGFVLVRLAAVAAQAGVSPATAQRHINRLVSLGLLDRRWSRRTGSDDDRRFRTDVYLSYDSGLLEFLQRCAAHDGETTWGGRRSIRVEGPVDGDPERGAPSTSLST